MFQKVKMSSFTFNDTDDDRFLLNNKKSYSRFVEKKWTTIEGSLQKFLLKKEICLIL